MLIGYKRPDQYDKDDPVFDVIQLILSSGRTGLMYKDMVRDKRIARGGRGDLDFPGGKYPNLFVVLPGAGAGPHGGGKREGVR